MCHLYSSCYLGLRLYFCFQNSTEEESQDQTGRAKSILLKKKLEEKDRIIKEKDETVNIKEQQIEVKEKIIAEREEIIATLTKQLEDKTKLMEEMNTQGSTGDDAEVLLF